jgi:hypothetical protein
MRQNFLAFINKILRQPVATVLSKAKSWWVARTIVFEGVFQQMVI